MSNRHGTTKLVAAVFTIATLLMAGTSTVVAAEPGPLACGGGWVSLDFLRGNETTDVGRDELYIQNSNGRKVWPLSTSYVSLGGDGAVAQVDKCAAVGWTLELWDVDDVGQNDHIGNIRLRDEASGQHRFCCGGGGDFTLDIDA